MLNFIIFTFLLMLIISILPQLLYIGLFVWVIMAIVRALFPRQHTNTYHEKRVYREPPKENQKSSSSEDIIDVEYRERDADDEN